MGSSRIQKARDKDRVNKNYAGDRDCHNYPVFSFAHITTNNKYNYKFFEKDVRKRHDNYSLLMERLSELSKTTWTDLHALEKRVGLEYIPIEQLNFKPFDTLIPGDAKFISIRFANQACRIIGERRRSGCAIFYIYGFDFDHSAYKHL